jgi:catechol 2,3-dioxygenase-like lactoylglutathione lyase family enzyme
MSLTLTTVFVAIATLNFDRLVHFYQQLLEQAPVALIPNGYAEFQLPGMKLGIFRPKATGQTAAGSRQQAAGDSPHGLSLCIEVANLESAIAHLARLGYPPPGLIITASHGREIYAFDPDGNWLILHQSHPTA